MPNMNALSSLGGTLVHNSIYVGIAFVVLLILAQLLTRLALRVAVVLLGSKALGISDETQQSWQRKIRTTGLLLTGVGTLALIGAGGLATWRQVRVGDYLRAALGRMQTSDWIDVGLAIAKTIGILILVSVLRRVSIASLQFLSDRLRRIESLAGRHERLTELLNRLRLFLSSAILFGALLMCARILGLPEGIYRILFSIGFLVTAVYAARFAVGASHLVIDVVFDASDMLSQLESPLRYLGRFRHLAALTKNTADYFIYVGLATVTIDQLRPGTWASEVGRLAIRIIAIFYISRVLVEVCVLFINEFFLNRAEHSDAEFQQRQTLVPVAAGFLRYGIYFSAVVMMLRVAGIDPTPLIAGAGVAGVALGLGAQAFVGDIVAGFFILFENLFLVGDYVEVSGVKGRVEEIGVRVTKLRDEAGVLHAIPNGEVRKVSSHSKGYVNVVIDLLIPYDEDLQRVVTALEEKTTALRAEEPAIMGLTEFDVEDLRENAVLMRTTTMVKPGTDEDMSSIIRRAFLETLVAAGVSAPYARRVVVPFKPIVGKSAPSGSADKPTSLIP